jgi:tetratricopeptide (TPR) repeat protein
MQRTLSIQEASFGSNHPLVATSLGNLAELLRATNRVKEAEPLARRALKISETSLGPSHPTVATRLNNLGLVLSAGKNFREAEMLHQRALRIDEASLGQNHPDVGRDLGNLAGLYSALGRLDEAEPLLRRNLEIFVAFERETGHHHPHFRIAVGAYYGLLVDLKIPNEQITARLRDVLGPKLASTILGPFQVTITEVVKGGQAESLGLRTGDLFVSYDGQAITSMEQLIHLTDESKGEAIPLEVLRDGKRLTFSAKPGKLAAIIENRPVLPAAGAEAAK